MAQRDRISRSGRAVTANIGKHDKGTVSVKGCWHTKSADIAPDPQTIKRRVDKLVRHLRGLGYQVKLFPVA